MEKITKLKNGATLLYSSRDDDLASFAISFNVGSVSDPSDKTGIAHCIEHMMFKGCNGKSAAEFSKLTDSLGLSSNAFTTYNQTCYYGQFLYEDTELVLKLFCEMINSPNFDEKELELEKGVIHQEIIMSENDPQNRGMNLIMREFYQANEYARPVLGSWEDVSKLTPSDLFDFKNTHYCGANCIIGYSGKASLEEVKALLEKELLIKQGSVSPILGTSVRLGNQTKILVDAKTDQNMICVFGAGFDNASKDGPACNLLFNCLCGGFSSRLIKRIREELGLCYYIGIQFSNPDHDFNYPYIFCVTDADPIMVSNEIKAVIIEAIKDGFSKEEVKTSKKSTEMLLLESSCDQLDYANRLVGTYLSCRKLPQEYFKHRANALKNASYKSVNDAVDGLFGETLTVIVKKAEEKGFFARLVEMLKGCL